MMDYEKLLPTILNTTYTKPDLYRRIGLLRSYYENIFFHKDGIRSPQSWGIHKNISQTDINSLADIVNKTSGFINRENLYDFIRYISKAIKTLPTITLYTALSSDQLDIERLGKWLRKQNHPLTLIVFVKDPEKIAGLAFAKEGKMYDFSLNYFIHKKRTDIMNIFNDYA